MPKRQTRFISNEEGATAIEYGLIIGLLGAALVAAASQFGGDLAGIFEVVASHFGATPSS